MIGRVESLLAGSKLMVAVTLLMLGVMTGACGDDSDSYGEDGDSSDMSVAFANLEDGASVSSPVEACLDISGMTIEPAGEVKDGHGHHHILVDLPEDELESYESGSADVPIPSDETHIHMGDGSVCKSLELEPGKHTLLAVVADGLHVPMDPPVTAKVSIIVE